MLLLVKRYLKTKESTIGRLYVNGQFFCYTLEDTDRDLTAAMTVEQIAAVKVYGQTAIPRGQYEVAVSYSNNFKKRLPILLGVKGFEGIRIHAGNTAANTLGCLLVGFTQPSANFVGESRDAAAKLMELIDAAVQKEKVFIDIS